MGRGRYGRVGGSGEAEKENVEGMRDRYAHRRQGVVVDRKAIWTREIHR